MISLLQRAKRPRREISIFLQPKLSKQFDVEEIINTIDGGHAKVLLMTKYLMGTAAGKCVMN